MHRATEGSAVDPYDATGGCRYGFKRFFSILPLTIIGGCSMLTTYDDPERADVEVSVLGGITKCKFGSMRGPYRWVHSEGRQMKAAIGVGAG